MWEKEKPEWYTKKLIQKIARYQLDAPEEKGIKIKELLNQCVEDMLCTSSKEIRELVAEAKDHKVVQERNDEKGFMLYFIPYPPNMLEKIINDWLTGDTDDDSDGSSRGFSASSTTQTNSASVVNESVDSKIKDLNAAFADLEL